MSAESESVWWAELLLGGVCCLTAAAFALATTSVGPFASVAVVYGNGLAALYVLAALCFGLVFLHSGVQRSLYGSESDDGDHGPAREAGVVARNDSEA